MTRTVLPAPYAPYEYRGTVGDVRWDPLAPEVVAVARRLALDPFWKPTAAEMSLLCRPPLPFFLIPIGGRHGELTSR